MSAATETTIALPDALGQAAREFLARPQHLLIGGERVEAADGRTFATLDPASGREIVRVSQAGPEDVARAAATAFSMSCSPARGTCAISRPVAGSSVANVRPSAASGRSSPISRRCGWEMKSRAGPLSASGRASVEIVLIAGAYLAGTHARSTLMLRSCPTPPRRS